MPDCERLKRFARKMRKEPTPAEQLLWRLVRNRRLVGYRFRRQDSLGPYILDCYCPVARLVIELDGDSHLGREAYDLKRDDFLRAHGLLILRIANGHLHDDSDAVLELIARRCAEGALANPKVRGKVDANGRFHPKPGQ